LPENYVGKMYKMLEFYVIFAGKIIKRPKFLRYLLQKINETSEFYMKFAQNARILHGNCPPKNIFPDFFLGGHVSYAYECK